MPESRTGVGRLAFGIAAIVIALVEGGGELGDFAGEDLRGEFVLRELSFKGVDPDLDLSEFAFQGEWALRAWLATGDGHVVKRFAGWGEEKGLRIGEGRDDGRSLRPE